MTRSELLAEPTSCLKIHLIDDERLYPDYALAQPSLDTERSNPSSHGDIEILDRE